MSVGARLTGLPFLLSPEGCLAVRDWRAIPQPGSFYLDGRRGRTNILEALEPPQLPGHEGNPVRNCGLQASNSFAPCLSVDSAVDER